MEGKKRLWAKYGTDLDEHRAIVIPDRRAWFESALTEATTTVQRFPEANLDVKELAMLYAFSTDNAGVQLSISSGQDSQPAEQQNG